MEQKLEREAAFFDHAYARRARRPTYDFYMASEGSKRFFRSFLQGHAPDRRALDYGCGRGTNSLFLAQCGARVTSVDISRVALDQARARIRAQDAPEPDFAQMNGEQLALARDAFDLVCGMAILHHLDLERSLSELARVLKPEGSAIFIEPLGHNPLINLFRWFTPKLRTADEHPILSRDLVVMRRHFRTVEPHFFTLFPLVAAPLRGRRVYSRLLEALIACDRAVFRRVPPLRWMAWQVVIVLKDPIKTLAR
jgi:SAM-dependent methyltransferase